MTRPPASSICADNINIEPQIHAITFTFATVIQKYIDELSHSILVMKILSGQDEQLNQVVKPESSMPKSLNIFIENTDSNVMSSRIKFIESMKDMFEDLIKDALSYTVYSISTSFKPHTAKGLEIVNRSVIRDVMAAYFVKAEDALNDIIGSFLAVSIKHQQYDINIWQQVRDALKSFNSILDSIARIGINRTNIKEYIDYTKQFMTGEV